MTAASVPPAHGLLSKMPKLEFEKVGKVQLRRRLDAGLFANRPIGREDGYASLADAKRALRLLTGGFKPAGVIFRLDDRYWTASLGVHPPLSHDHMPFWSGMFKGQTGIDITHSDAWSVVYGKQTFDKDQHLTWPDERKP